MLRGLSKKLLTELLIHVLSKVRIPELEHKERLRGNMKISTKKRMLECYVFLVLRYACESLTLDKVLQNELMPLNSSVTEGL